MSNIPYAPTLPELFNKFASVPLDAHPSARSKVPRNLLSRMAEHLLKHPSLSKYSTSKRNDLARDIKAHSVTYARLFKLHADLVACAPRRPTLTSPSDQSPPPSPIIPPGSSNNTTLPSAPLPQRSSPTLASRPPHLDCKHCRSGVHILPCTHDNITSPPLQFCAPSDIQHTKFATAPSTTPVGKIQHCSQSVCYFCNFGHAIAICTTCINNVVRFEDRRRVPFYHKQLQLNRATLCRMAIRDPTFATIKAHVKKAHDKWLKNHVNSSKKVAPQPPRDFDLSQVDEFMPSFSTRDARRMATYNRLQEIISSDIKNIPEVIAHLQGISESLPPEQTPQEELDRYLTCQAFLDSIPPSKQGDDISSHVSNFLSSIVTFLQKSKILTPIIIIIIDAAVISLLWWLLTTRPQSTILKILKWIAVINLSIAAISYTIGAALSSFECVNNIINLAEKMQTQKNVLSTNLTASDAFKAAQNEIHDAVLPFDVKHVSTGFLDETLKEYEERSAHFLKLSSNDKVSNLVHINALNQFRKFDKWSKQIIAELTLRADSEPNISSQTSSAPKPTKVAAAFFVDSESDDDLSFDDENSKPQETTYQRFQRLQAQNPSGPKVEEVEDPPEKQGLGEIADKAFLILSEGVNSIAESAATIVEETAKLTVKDARTTFHNIATTVRDGKTLFDVFVPLITTIVATVYEGVTGKPYITARDKIYHDKLTPLFKEITDIEDTPGFKGLIISSVEFRHQVEEIIQKYSALRDDFFKSAPERMNAIFLSRQATLNTWKIYCYDARSTGSSRPVTVYTELCGHPSTGKSTFVAHMLPSIHAALVARKYPGIPDNFTTGLVYDRKIENDYFDGENEQPYWTADDILQSLDPERRFQQTMEIIQIVNSAPYQLHMSAVADKANHFCRAKFLFTTRNGALLPNNLNITDPMAFYRRRKMLIEMHNDLKYAGLKPSDPNYVKYWVLRLHDGFGNYVRDITASEFVSLAVEYAFENLESLSVIPALVPQVDIKDLASTLNKQSQEALIYSRNVGAAMPLQTHAAPFVPEDKKKIPSRPCKYCDHLHWDWQCPQRKNKVSAKPLKQGGGGSKSSPKIIFGELVTEFETATSEETYLLRPEVDRDLWSRILEYLDIPSVEQRLKERRVYLFETWTEYAKVAHDALAQLASSVTQSFVALKVWTIATWDEFIKIIKFTPLIAKTILKGIATTWKDVVSYAISSVTEHIKNHKWKYIFGAISVVTAFAAGAAAIYAFTRPEKPQPQSRHEDNREDKAMIKAQEKEERAAEAHDRKIDALIKKSQVHDPKWQGEAVSLPDLPRHQFSSTDIPKLILFTKNLYYLSTSNINGTNSYNGQLLFISGRTAVTSKHIATVITENRRDGGQVKILKKVGGQEHESLFMANEILQSPIEGCELTALKFPKKCPQHVSLLPHILTDADIAQSNQISDCQLFSRLPNGDLTIKDLGMITLDYFNPYWRTHPEDPSYLFWTSTLGGTISGDSGGIWFTTNPKLNHSLAGIHSGGNAKTAFGAPAIQSLLAPFVKDEPGMHDLPDIVATGYEPVSIAPNYVSVATVKQGNSLPNKNAISPSVLSPYLYEMGWKTKTLPSSIKPIIPYQVDSAWKKKGVVYDGEFTSNTQLSPLDNIAVKLRYIAPCFPQQFLTIFDNLHMFWPVPKSKTYTFYPPEEIIYGHPSLDVEPIRKNTSPGYPFTILPELKTRKMIFGNKKDEIHPKFTERLNFILAENEKEGGQYHPIYTLSLKVERLPVQKTMDAMTRSIFCGPVDFQVYGQMLYYDLLAAFASQPSHQWTIGMNPHSQEWGMLFRRLSRHRHGLETDAKRWDNSQEFVLPEFVIEQIIRYLQNLHINNRSGVISGPSLYKHLRKAGFGAMQSFVLVVNTLYFTPQQVKSGNFWTTLLNCLINEIRWKVVFAVAAIEAHFPSTDLLTAYQANVEAAYHGDDALSFVSDEVFPFFNMASATYLWKKLFNIELTPPGANKTDTTLKTEVLKEDASLIKRKFVYDGGFVYAPLEWNVITDMCLWVTDPSENPKISSHNIASALMEAAHHPRAKFDELEADLKKAAVLANLPWRAHSYQHYRTMFRGTTPFSSDVSAYVESLRWS